MLRNTDCLTKRCLRRAIVPHRQEKLASHSVRLSFVAPALGSIGNADCLDKLPQPVLRLLHFAIGVRQ
jgi:hypothetical protein